MTGDTEVVHWLAAICEAERSGREAAAFFHAGVRANDSRVLCEGFFFTFGNRSGGLPFEGSQTFPTGVIEQE